MIIRPACLEDMSEITAIYGHSVTHEIASFELEAPSYDEMVKRWKALTLQDCPYLVSHDEDGHILGYAYAAPFHARAAYAHTVENSIYIDAKAQGQGIGSQLLSALIDICRTRGYKQMVALITENESSPSVTLHKKFGFVHVGRLADVGYKHGRWLSTVYMQKSL